MSTKKIMSIIAWVVIGVLGLFAFILYATIKTKSTGLNQYAPYNEWVGRTVTMDKETVLFKEKISMNDNAAYPYILLDSRHPQWQYVEEQKRIGDIEEIATFHAGTELRLEKAIQYTNGVSGFSYPTVFGTIISNGKEYRVGYQWGKMDIGKSFDKVEKCWQFHQAPWQKVRDTSFYALPTAKFW
ncbi:hypothetical protein [Sphingobacterium tabacisoli]|uniref:DUF4178 domain-containing protein n=1 Tax=Sphingobacterium tabacisoli TaxID=2044855 RepID=A0ABW5L5Y3_9SPHI|nr:hypothetical protein [Sphingobacterium tabacisoli]